VALRIMADVAWPAGGPRVRALQEARDGGDVAGCEDARPCDAARALGDLGPGAGCTGRRPLRVLPGGCGMWPNISPFLRRTLFSR
jgi:hypothetical protein